MFYFSRTGGVRSGLPPHSRMEEQQQDHREEWRGHWEGGGYCHHRVGGEGELHRHVQRYLYLFLGSNHTIKFHFCQHSLYCFSNYTCLV